MKNFRLFFCGILLFCVNYGYSQNYSYDQLNRLTEVNYGDSISIEYCYDELGNRTCYNIISDELASPDLLVSNTSVSNPNLCLNSSFTITYNEENIGIGNSSGFQTKIYLSEDNQLDGLDEVLETFFTTSLDAAATVEKTSSLTLPASISAGDYFIIIEIDSEQNVDELSEANNQSSIAFTVNNQSGFDYDVFATDATCDEANGSIDIQNVMGVAPITYSWGHDENLDTNIAEGLSPGTYYFSITDGNGCVEVGSELVSNEGSLPSPSFTYTIDGNTVLFISNTQNSDSILWDFGDEGSSNQEYISHVYDTSAIYAVCLEAANGCGNNTYCSNINLTVNSIYSCSNFQDNAINSSFQKIYSIQDSLDLSFTEISILPNNTIIAAGTAGNDLSADPYITFSYFNIDGVHLYTTRHDCEYQTIVNSIKTDSTGRIFFAGKFVSLGIDNAWSGELDYCGNIIWSKKIGGSDTDCFYDFEIINSNSLVFIGRTSSFGQGSSDVLLANLSKNGTVNWAKTLGSFRYESCRSIAKVVDSTSNISFAVTGKIYGYPTTNTYNQLFVSFDSLGTVIDSRGTHSSNSAFPDRWTRGQKIVFDKTSSTFLVGIDTYDFNELLDNVGNYYNSAISRVQMDGNYMNTTLYDDIFINSIIVNADSSIVLSNRTGVATLNSQLGMTDNFTFSGINPISLSKGVSSGDFFFFLSNNQLIKTNANIVSGCNEKFKNYSAANINLTSASTTSILESMDITNAILASDLNLVQSESLISETSLCPSVDCPLDIYINNKIEGICQGSSFTFLCTDPSAFSVEWYVNDSLVSNSLHCTVSFDSLYQYTIKAVSYNGFCSSIDSFLVAVGEFSSDIDLEWNNVNPSDYFMNDGSIEIQSNSELNNLSYSWSTGDTSQVLSNLKSGTYSVTITYNDYCEVSDSATLYDIALISEADTFPEFQLSILNENSELINFNVVDTLDSSLIVLGNSTHIAVLDSYGRIVWVKEHNLNQSPVRISGHEDKSITLVSENKLARFDSFGELLWSYEFSDSPYAENLEFLDFAVMNDSLIVIVGNVFALDVDDNNSNEYFAYATCLNIYGEQVWEICRGADDKASGYTGVEINGQDIIVAGFYWKRILIDKISIDGSVADSDLYRLDGSSWSYNAKALALTEDGDKIVYFEGGREGFVRISEDGNDVLWQQFFHTNIPEFDEIRINEIFTTDTSIIANVRVYPKNDPGWKQGVLEFTESELDISSYYIQDSPVNQIAIDKSGLITSCGQVVSKTNILDVNCVPDVFEINWYDVSAFEHLGNFNPIEHSAQMQFSNINIITNESDVDIDLQCPTCEQLVVSSTIIEGPICVGDSIFFDVSQDSMLVKYWVLDECQIDKDTNSIVYVPSKNGSFRMVAIGQNGMCFDTLDFLYDVGNPDFVFDLGDNIEICGQYTITPSIDSLEILWSTGEITSTIDVFNSGVYSATITDFNGCYYSDSIEVVILPDLNIVSSIFDNTCNDNGVIQIDASQGNMPYSFLWSNGSTDNGLSNLTGGEYNLTISDSGSCSDTFSYLIEDLDFTIESISNDIQCYDSGNGSLLIEIPGSPEEYPIEWSTGDTTHQIMSVGPGIYSATITNSGCSLIETFELGNESFFLNDTLYACSNDSITISLINIDGLNPGAFQWSNGEFGFSITISIEESTTFSVSYLNECSDDIMVIIYDDLSISTNVIHPLCYGSLDGSVAASVDDPLGHGYTIDWSDFSINSSGNYSVTVTDATTGCEYIESFELIDPDPIFAQIAKENESACGKSDASAAAIVIGGTVPYTYLWSQNEGTSAIADSLQGGYYTLTISDANGCSETSQVIIESNEGIDFEYSKDITHSICSEISSISIEPQSDLSYSYEWSSLSSSHTLFHDFDGVSQSLVENKKGEGYSKVNGNAIVTDYLSIGYNNTGHLKMDPAHFNNLNDFEFSCDFKLNAINSGLNTLLSVASSNYDNGLIVGYRPDGRVWVIIHAVGKLYGSSLDLSLDEWHSISVSRIGSELEVILNGISLGIQSSPDVTIQSEYACLGQEQDAVGGGFATNQSLNGSIDNVSLKRLNSGSSNSLNNAEAGPHFTKVLDENGCETTINSIVSSMNIDLPTDVRACIGESVLLQSNFSHDLSDSYDNLEFEFIDELILDFTKPFNESIPTEHGYDYVILANGTFTVWQGCQYLEDKVQYFDPSFNYNNTTNTILNRNLVSGTYYDTRPVSDEPHEDNNYVYHISSDGSPINFVFSDNGFNNECQCYPNNCGYFRVNIYKLIEPTLAWSTGANSDSTTFTANENQFVSLSISTPSFECEDSVLIDVTAVLNQDSIETCLFEDELLNFDDINNKSFEISQNLDYIRVPNAPSLQIIGDLTIEMWLKPSNYSQRRNPLNKAFGGEYTITHEKTGRFNFYHGISGVNAQPFQGIASTSSIPLNQWSHIAIVRDYTDMMIRWFINGSLDREVPFTYEINTASISDVLIGEGYVHGYHGNIDEVRIWNKALSAETIETWKDQTIVPIHPNYANLQMYHQFDFLSDEIAIDRTSNHNDGYKVGNPALADDTPVIINNNYTWPDGIQGNERLLGNLQAGTHLISYDDGGIMCSNEIEIVDLAGTIIWISETGNWTEVTNWDKLHIPLKCEDVILRSENSQPLTVTLNTNITSKIRSLYIEEAVTFISNGNLTITNSTGIGFEIDQDAYITNNGTIDISYSELESILCYGNITNNGTINVYDDGLGPQVKLGDGCDFNIKGGGPVNLIKE